jgi:hypothetical protein
MEPMRSIVSPSRLCPTQHFEHFWRVMSAIGLDASHGNKSFFRRPIIFPEWLAAQRGACLSNHSNATASKVGWQADGEYYVNSRRYGNP